MFFRVTARYIMKERALAASPCGDPISDLIVYWFRFLVLLIYVHHLIVGG